MNKSSSDLAKLLKQFSTGELMSEVRRRQAGKQSAQKRSDTARKAAAVRWAKKRGRDILEGKKV